MLGSIPFYFMTLIIYITVYRAPRLTRQLNDVKEDHSRTCRAMHALVDRLPLLVNIYFNDNHLHCLENDDIADVV